MILENDKTPLDRDLEVPCEDCLCMPICRYKYFEDLRMTCPQFHVFLDDTVGPEFVERELTWPLKYSDQRSGQSLTAMFYIKRRRGCDENTM